MPISLAKLCFPNEDITGDSGHDGKDVMYVAFTGSNAVPGASGADWTAKALSNLRIRSNRWETSWSQALSDCFWGCRGVTT